MISIARQTIDFYLKNFRTPTTSEIEIQDQSLLGKQGSLFVTIYKKGEIRGASGNIKEIKTNIAEEIIENTVYAITKDSRFKPLIVSEANDVKIRIDMITSRKVLQNGEINTIDPAKYGILALKKDYNAMAVILPNINPILLTGEDLIPVLEKKFGVKNFEEKDYIIYQIETNVEDDFVSE